MSTPVNPTNVAETPSKPKKSRKSSNPSDGKEKKRSRKTPKDSAEKKESSSKTSSKSTSSQTLQKPTAQQVAPTQPPHLSQVIPKAAPFVPPRPIPSSFSTATLVARNGPPLQHPIASKPVISQEISKEDPFVVYTSNFTFTSPCILSIEPKIKYKDDLQILECLQELILKHNILASISPSGMNLYCIVPTHMKASIVAIVDKLDLKVSACNEGDVPSGAMENALRCYVKCQLSDKGWHRLGHFYACGDLFGSTTTELMLVEMELNVTADCKQTSVSMRCSVGRTSPFPVKSIVGSEKLMKELEKGAVVEKGQIGPDEKLCTVLPALSIARIQSVQRASAATPHVTGLSSPDQYLRYWRLAHLYRLPPIQDYVTVRFYEGGETRTYPSSCVWSPLGLPEYRTRAREEGDTIRNKFLQLLKSLQPEGVNTPFANLQRVEMTSVKWTSHRAKEE